MKTWKIKPSLFVSLSLVLGLSIWPFVTGKDITREVVFTMLLFMSLSSSLNLLLGYTGYVSFGHVVYFGLGGYVGFYLLSVQNQPLWLAMAAGGLSSALLAFLVGKAILKLRGAYFALVTIGVNEAIRAFINNFEPFGGPIGMPINFKIYQKFGGPGQALWMTYYVMIALTVTVVVVSHLVRNSKFGLSLLAIREDEDAAEVMGVKAPNAKTWSYVLSALFPGMIGALFFFKNGNIEPLPAFRLHMSIEMIVMVMLGGQGTVLGPLVGASGYQWLRGYLLTSPIFKNIQLAVAGVLLLLIILFVPAGLVGWVSDRFPKLGRILQ